MREVLRLHLQNWQDQVPLDWIELFQQSAANFDAIDPTIPAPEEVFPPVLRDNPNGSQYLLKAFENIAPADVRVVIIGQDPYPDANRATGLAFEDGAAVQVSETRSPSLKRFVQSAAAELLRREDLAQNDAGWNNVRAEFDLPAMADLFQGMTEQGVICINAAWTFTGTSDQHLGANLKLWRPVVRHVIQQVIQRNANCVVLALGDKAQKLFNSKCPRPAHFIEHCHPQARGGAWFARPNPLTQVNQHLAGLFQEEVCWLPGVACCWLNDH